MQAPVTDVLEVIASQRPDTIRWLLAQFEIEVTEEIAARWRIEVAEISATAVRTASDLDRLDRNPRAPLADPNLGALTDFAQARRARTGGSPVARMAAVAHASEVLSRFLGRNLRGPLVIRRPDTESHGDIAAGPSRR